LDWEGNIKSRVPSGYWNDIQHHSMFFDWLSSKLGLRNVEDWYKVTKDTVVNHGGATILASYGHSHVQALQKLYPEIEWQLWRFPRMPKSFWGSPKHQEELFQFVAKKLDVYYPDDWHGITTNHLKMIRGGDRLLYNHKNSLMNILRKFVPSHNWHFDKWKLSTTSRSQQYLFKCVSQLFGHDVEIHCNERHPMLLYDDTNFTMQLDIWIPKYNIALEFQGEQHYVENSIMLKDMGGLAYQYKKDDIKKKACNDIQVDLLCIPFWWDYSLESLVSIIAKVIDCNYDLYFINNIR
jgi:hypothetical protein